MLGEFRAGKREIEARLMEAVYPELRRIAARYMAREQAGHTLQATALVNEAYVELVGPARPDWQNRAHFFAIAAQLMRRILVDHARKKRAQKRDGARQRVELTDGLVVSEDRLEEILLIDAALTRLAEWDPRQAKIVELRFFSGLTEDETAEVLGVSPRTVKRDWNVARAWLHSELNSAKAEHGSH
ncbi:MAG: sigma-70 family RNA polymerase sigma factor [Acidobacteriia bacterium]|nr:sigma-70 family RNA polymerase sigma factor [Terriglobia bacterium]